MNRKEILSARDYCNEACILIKLCQDKTDSCSIYQAYVGAQREIMNQIGEPEIERDRRLNK